MRLAISSRSFDAQLDDARLRLWDIPGEARTIGVSHVELFDNYLQPAGLRIFGPLRRFFSPPSPAPPDRAYEPRPLGRIEEALTYYSMQLAAWGCDSELGDPALLPRARAYARLAIGAARQLGAPLVRLTLDADATSRHIEAVIESLGLLVVDAEVAGVRLAVENSRAPGSVERLLGIVRSVDSPWLGVYLNLDAFDPHSPAELFEQIAAVAIHTRITCREGGDINGVDRAYVGVLRTLHYDGAISVEYVGNGDPEENLSRALETISRW